MVSCSPFINHDGVPWNNNNAEEHAVRGGFTRLRNVIVTQHTEEYD